MHSEEKSGVRLNCLVISFLYLDSLKVRGYQNWQTGAKELLSSSSVNSAAFSTATTLPSFTIAFRDFHVTMFSVLF